MKPANPAYYLTRYFLFAIALLFSFGCKDKTKATEASEATNTSLYMYVIERDLPGIGKMSQQELKDISQKSCDVLREMGSDIEWDHSYVTENKLYCVYRAKDSSLIKMHAQLGGFPANRISIAGTIISPKTAEVEIKE